MEYFLLQGWLLLVQFTTLTILEFEKIFFNLYFKYLSHVQHYDPDRSILLSNCDARGLAQEGYNG